MALTKVTNSMISGDVFSVLDYSSLVFTHTAKAGGTNTIPSFQSWKLAIQAACDAAYANGGGVVLLPAKGSSYLIDDAVVVKSNTRFVAEEWIELGDYTTFGATFYASGENIEVLGLRLNCNFIYFGISGDNGATATGLNPTTEEPDFTDTYLGTNIKFIDARVKNCAFGTVDVQSTTGSPLNYYYGGKAFQFELLLSNVMVDNAVAENCAIGYSTVRGAGAPVVGPIIFSNVTASLCGMFAYVGQSTGTQSPSVTSLNELGDKAQVIFSNFVANECGINAAQNGSLVSAPIYLDGACYTKFDAGIVINKDPADFPNSFIRGRHRYCEFTNVIFSGDCDSVINNSTTRVDASGYNGAATTYLQSGYNRYSIEYRGDHAYVLDADGAETYAPMINSKIDIITQSDATVEIVSTAVSSFNSFIQLTSPTKLLQATTVALAYDRNYINFAFNNPYAITFGTTNPNGDLDNASEVIFGTVKTAYKLTNPLIAGATQDYLFTQADHGKSAFTIYANGNSDTGSYAMSIMRMDNSNPPNITLISLGNNLLTFTTPSAGTLRFTNGTAVTQTSDISFLRIA
jgi:hypothetical protein